MSVDVRLSKLLSYLLRHGGHTQGINLSPEGYVDVDDLLKHKSISGNFNRDSIERVVRTNDKQRFTLLKRGEKFYIKANQGHSLKEVNSLNVQPITEKSVLPIVIHGTFAKHWASIKSSGLSRMSRNHIHFASGLPKDQAVISGMRRSCEVYIYIDISKALSDGIKFYKSENGVILTPGDDKGFLDKKYFKSVVDAKTGASLDF